MHIFLFAKEILLKMSLFELLQHILSCNFPLQVTLRLLAVDSFAPLTNCEAKVTNFYHL